MKNLLKFLRQITQIVKISKDVSRKISLVVNRCMKKLSTSEVMKKGDKCNTVVLFYAYSISKV